MKTIDEHGQELAWNATYWRYRVECQETFGSLEAAYRFLVDGEDEGSLATYSITGPDGRVIMDKQQFTRAYISRVKPEDLITKMNLTTPKEIET